jgi:hypothetical protein
MKIKTYEEVLTVPAVAAEIESLNMEIKDLKEALYLTIDTLKDTVYATRSFREQRLTDAERLIG